MAGPDRSGAPPPLFYEPFETVRPGAWRLFASRSQADAVVGRSVDGAAILVVHYEGCGTDCTNLAPTFTLLFAGPPPRPCPTLDCRARVSFGVDGGRLRPEQAMVERGVLVQTAFGLVGVALESIGYEVGDYDGVCRPGDRRCVDRSFVPLFRAGRRTLIVQVDQGSGRLARYSFDLRGRPFRSLMNGFAS